MTGAGNYGGRFKVSEITFNGDKGTFYYRQKDAEKDAEGKYPKEDLGKGLDVVFMKIRRKLSVYKKSGGMSTNEHNTKADFVVLYGGKDKGTANEIRERHQELRTQQLVYSFFPTKKEVVRVVIKGASLGSETKKKEVLKFYDYLQTFKGDDHVHEFFTKLIPVEEEGPKGTYFAMSFVRGEKLTEVQQEKVNERIEELHNAIEASDAAFKQKMSVGGTSSDPTDIQMDADEEEEPPAPPPGTLSDADFVYPEEDIDPKDIPF